MKMPEWKPFLKQHRKWILGGSLGILVLALGCGIWYYLGHSSKEPVYVYPFQYIGMTEYWGDSQESYGPVSSDNIQTVYLSDTQSVTQILVEAGDQVKKGDLLMSFDTTLNDLALERKRLDVEKQHGAYGGAGAGGGCAGGREPGCSPQRQFYDLPDEELRRQQ